MTPAYSHQSRFWILGPSGAGKTTALELLKESVNSGDKPVAKLFTTDLDLFGYRRRETDWQEWIIPPSCLVPLVERGHETGGTLVVAGLGSNMEDLLKQGQSFGFEFIVIIPSEKTLEDQRRIRGDAPEKVKEAPSSLATWTDYIGKFNLTNVHPSAEEVVEFIHSRMDNVSDHEDATLKTGKFPTDVADVDQSIADRNDGEESILDNRL